MEGFGSNDPEFCSHKAQANTESQEVEDFVECAVFERLILSEKGQAYEQPAPDVLWLWWFTGRRFD